MKLQQVSMLIALLGVLASTISGQGVTTSFNITNSCTEPKTIGWFIPGYPPTNSYGQRCNLAPMQSCTVTPARYNFTTQTPITFREESTYTDVRFGISVNYTSVKQRVYGKDLFAVQSAGSIESSIGVQTPPGTFPGYLHCGSSSGSANCTYAEANTRTHSFIFEANTGGQFQIEWCAKNRTEVGSWQPCLRKSCNDGRSKRHLMSWQLDN